MESKTHGHTDVMNTLKKQSIPYISLELQGLGQGLAHKERALVREGTKERHPH